MTPVADQPVRATVRAGGASRAGARRQQAPRTIPLRLPPEVELQAATLAGWSWTAVRPAGGRGARSWGWATHRQGRSWAVAGAPGTHRPSGPAAVLRDKLREWGRRYLPAELVGTLTALTAALCVHALTGSLASAALTGSVSESIAYYGVMLHRVAPAIWAEHAGAGRTRRLLGTGRGLVAEACDFLAAEVADTFLVRPGLIYLAAGWAGSGVAGGLLIGKLLADVGFYAVVIPSYELRKRLMHR